MCAQPCNETIGSAMLVYPVPSQDDSKDILEFICELFISHTEAIALLQRDKLFSPDNKLTSMKNDKVQILSCRGTYSFCLDSMDGARAGMAKSAFPDDISLFLSCLVIFRNASFADPRH